MTGVRLKDFLRDLKRVAQRSGIDSAWEKIFDNQFQQRQIIEKLYAKNGFNIVMTCPACPEQYDVFKDGKQVAYYRLRHGDFTVDYPDAGGETIYEAETKGDGAFEPDERLLHLTNAMRKVLEKIKKK